MDHNSARLSFVCCTCFVVGNERLTSSIFSTGLANLNILISMFGRLTLKGMILMICGNKTYGMSFGKKYKRISGTWFC